MGKTTLGKFYVYALFRDDGRIFYIGKGNKGRWGCHVIRARAGEPGHRSNIIRDMQARGVEMPKVKLHKGLTEAVAHKYEVALIKAIGRYPFGPLVNLTNGGDGISGHIHSPETIALMSMRKQGHSVSPESRAKMSAARLGRKASLEERAKLSVAHRGIKRSAEAIAKTVAAHRGTKRSAETCAKISASQLGRTASSETRAKMSASQIGRIHTPEAREKISAAHRGKTISLEQRAQISEANRRRKPSPETRAKIATGNRGKTQSPEARAAISAARLALFARRRHEETLSAHTPSHAVVEYHRIDGE